MAENMKQERIGRGLQRQARYRDVFMMLPSQTREKALWTPFAGILSVIGHSR